MGAEKNIRNVVESKGLINRLRRPAIVLSGVLTVFCFPSFNLSSLAWVCFVPLLLTLPGLRGGQSLRWGFLAGTLVGLGTLYWIYPTCRWGGVPWPMAGLAWGGLSAYLGLYWGLFGWCVVFFSRAPLWQRPFWFAMGWVALEWARSWFLGGFPWLTLACSQWQIPKHLALAQLGGSYAVSFLVILFNGTLATAILAWANKPVVRWAPVPGIAALIGLTAWSVWLWRRPAALADNPWPMAIIQGNIDQYKKWDRSYVDEIMSVYSTLTRDAALEKPRLIVWPETAVPGWIPNEPEPSQWVSDLARQSAVPLLVGAVTREQTGDYNAAFLISEDGKWADRYRKVHLVPFGEFVPFRRILSPFIRVLNDLGTFDAGPSAHVLSTPGGRVGVTICFEGLFPHLVRRFTRNGAQVLVNITNDGWYRDTAAPEQHFSATVLRAVENGRWMVRAANTGYSGFISPRGEIVSRSLLMSPAVLYGAPVPLDRFTFYARAGDVFVYLCLILLLFGGYNLLESRCGVEQPGSSRGS